MPLPVAQLKEMLRSAPDGFELPAATLAVAEAEPLFTDFLGGDLVLDDAQGDPDRLTVRGKLDVAGSELTGLPAMVRFATDDERMTVTGLEIAVGWPAWDIKTPFLERDLGPLRSLGFGSAYVVLEAAPDGFGRLVPMAVPGAGWAVDGDAYVKFLDPGEPDRATVIGEFGDGLSFGSLSALADLPFIGPGVMDQLVLPEPVRSVLAHVLVKDMSATFDWAAPTFSQVSVDLALDTREGWTLVDGLLTLDEFSAWVQLAPGPDGAPVVSGGLGARIRAGSVAMTAGVTLPELSVSASADRPEGGTDLVSGHLPDGFPAVAELDYLYVRCDVPTLDYLLAIGLDLDWCFTDGVVLKGLILELAGQGTRTPDATVIGTLALGETDVVVLASRSADGAWAVTGSAADITFEGFRTWFDTAFPTPLPSALAGLHLSEVSLSFDSAGTGEFTCTGRLPLGDDTPDSAFRLRVVIARGSGGTRSVTFEADLEVLVDLGDDDLYPMRFAVEFESGTGKRLTASWQATDGSVPLFPLLRALGLGGLGDLQDALPAALCPDLDGLAIAYDSELGYTVVSAQTQLVSLAVASLRDGQGASTWAAQVSVSVEAKVSQLPLLADLIPSDADLGLSGVRVLASSRPVPPELLGQLNEALTAAAPDSPVLPVLDAQQGGLPGGAWLALEYIVPGSAPALLTVPVGGVRPPAPQRALGQRAPAGQRVLEGVVLAPGETPPPEAEGPAGAWLELGRSFGPLAVRRIGMAYEAGTVWLMLDSALSAGGFTMAVQGLALGVDLNGQGFPVRTRLSGLAVDFERPPLRIAGALINIPQSSGSGYQLMVGGLLVVQLPRIGVTAVGAYQRREDGMPSLFVFGRATAPIGGPPPFRVTGVAAGFGFNSSLTIPEPSQVAEFPLVSGLEGGLSDDPMQVLDELTGRWVTPRQSQIWLAAGLDFTSFEFITGRLLLLLEAGNDLTVALLGTARAAFPRTGRALAQVKLQLRIVYRSAIGEFAATAILYDSYVIDPSCVLSGGFAFYMWSGKSRYAGDFVLTAGGYHRLYSPPAHYPQVPRLGFSWSLGNVDITGSAYFALTPSAVMAGGTLDVRYSAGPLKAWLHASAHMLVRWKPLHFEVAIGVTVGASLKVLFATLKGELGASLTIWGPPTGGTVTAKFVFIKVTIGFGSNRTSPPALDWPQFTELLPPKEQVLRVTMLEGLLADAEPPAGRDLDDPEAPWLVDPGGFTFLAETSVPASQLSFQDGASHSGKRLDIRPMRLSGRTSSFTVKVTTEKDFRGADAGSRIVERAGEWKVDVVDGDVPTALWGSPDPDEDDIFTGKDRLEDRPTGLKITVPPPVTSGATLGPIREAALAYEELPDVDHPRDPGDPPADDLVQPAPSAGAGVSRVAGHIDSDAAQDARTRLRQALDALLAPETDGLPDSPLSDYATRATRDGLPADPLLLAGAGARAHATTAPGSRA